MPPKDKQHKREEGGQGGHSRVLPFSAANEKPLEDRIEKLEKRVRSIEEQLVAVQAALATKKAPAPSKSATGSQPTPTARKLPAGQRYVPEVSPPLPPPRRSPSVHIDICICAVERRVCRRDRVDIFRQHEGDRRRFAGGWCRRMQV